MPDENLKRSNRIFYRPQWSYLIADIVLLMVTFAIILRWFPMNADYPFEKYDHYSVYFSLLWITSSYFFGRYYSVKYKSLNISSLQLLGTTLTSFIVMYCYMLFRAERLYSVWLLLSVIGIVFLINLLFTTLFHGYAYATAIEPEIERAPERGKQKVLQKAKPVSPEQRTSIDENLQTIISERAINYLHNQIDVYSSNTLILSSSTLFNFQNIQPFRYDTIVNLMPLNQIRGVNKMFGIINDRLPDDGLLVVCFEPQSVRKRRFFTQHNKLWGGILYAIDFLINRCLPKIIMTQRFYFDITGGRNRVFSKTEILGRLAYCGFSIKHEQKLGEINIVVAQRAYRPKTILKRKYGIFVKLNRIGKNGKTIEVYKLRTMHPYAEFLQDYIYETHHLQKGGKFSHDFRISSWGRFARKFWLDEFPMFINLLKGEMKLVGVRPISKQYYDLYSEELQQLRTQFKPGLLPPFYADMPTTLEEIQESELKYLYACKDNGTFFTDWKYFWKIVGNIVFRRARSK